MHTDSIKLRGDVEIKILDANGKVVNMHKYKNLIVTAGKTLLTELLAGITGNSIANIAFGTDATPPAITDTALHAYVLEEPVAISYPTPNQVTFTATMPAGTGNGNTFQELGLYCTTGMFARLAIGAIAKSTTYQIQVAWTISFQ